jgi:hypothetical protein
MKYRLTGNIENINNNRVVKTNIISQVKLELFR